MRILGIDPGLRTTVLAPAAAQRLHVGYADMSLRRPIRVAPAAAQRLHVGYADMSLHPSPSALNG
jgi:hypothetical protein